MKRAWLLTDITHAAILCCFMLILSACQGTDSSATDKKEIGAPPSKLPAPLAKLMEDDLEGECMVERGPTCTSQQKCARGRTRDEGAPWCCWEGQTWTAAAGCSGMAKACPEGSSLRGNSCHVEDPRAFYGPRCDRGSSADCYQLARALETCDDTTCDASRAIELYAENCTERDHLLSCEIYALRARSGTYIRRQSSAGLAALRNLCERSGYMACDSYAWAISGAGEDWSFTEAIRLHGQFCEAIPGSSSCTESYGLTARYASNSQDKRRARDHLHTQCVEKEHAYSCMTMAWLSRRDNENKGDYGFYVALLTQYLGDSCDEGDLSACDQLVGSSYSADFDGDLAIRALGRLCRAGNGSSCYQLGRALEKTAMERALDQFVKTCESTQHAPSCLRASYDFRGPRAPREDLERARELLFPACEQSHLYACYQLGIVHARLGDLDAAEAPLEVACDEGRYKACAGLGQRHIDTNRVESGRKLLLRACKAEVGAACAALSRGYERGDFGDKRPKAARKLTVRACKHGHSSSCFAIARDYAEGKDVDKSVIRALGYYEKACGLGHIAACDEALAQHQLSGRDEDMRSLLEISCRAIGHNSCQALRARWELTMTTLL